MTVRPDHIRAMTVLHTAKDVLFDLQVEQHSHDEMYHREIARLSLHQRLNHMALHFAKYTGKIAAAADTAGALPVYVDVLIIALSTANIINIALWDIIKSGDQDYPSLQAVGRMLASEMAREMNEHAALVSATAIASGRMAAACEKIDHLEEINFRAEMRHSLASLCRLSLAVIAGHGFDPVNAVRERLNGVKQRLKLHGRI
jgi:hypothetical protein